MADPFDMPPAWRAALQDVLSEPSLLMLQAALQRREAADAVIYPPAAERFAALGPAGPAAVKAVILGQDPYHNPGQAHGLAFSVPPGQTKPPSLRNILREAMADVGIAAPDHGSLTAWAGQGVLLLNTALTVERNKPASHARLGWEALTRRIVHVVSLQAPAAAFVLWGAHAQRYANEIDHARHLVIAAPHPSPLSAHRGFFGSRPFSRINDFLASRGAGPIDWSLA